jgi:antitoxin CptB
MKMSDADETRRKRLLFRSWHRGTKETDLLLGTFAERNLARFDPTQLSEYEAILEASDAELWDWLIHRHPIPADRATPTMRLLLAHEFTPPARSQ